MVQKYFYDKNYLLSNNYNRLRYDPEYEKETDATVYWQHNFPTEDHELRIEFNASGSDEQEDNQYTNVYYYPPAVTSFDNTLIGQKDKQQQKTELNTPYLKQVAVGKRDAQILYLGISYRFGKIIKKQNEEKLQFDNNL